MAKTRHSQDSSLNKGPSPEDIARGIRSVVRGGESPVINGTPVTDEPELRTTVSQDILLKDIDPRGTNVRSRMDTGELNNLVESIRQHGLLEPVIVQVLPKTRGYRYRLIAGFRRVAACRLVPLTILPARVIEGALGETEVQQLQLTENLQREEMSIHDIVASIEALRAAGLTQQQVADRLNFSLAKVRVYLQLGAGMRQNKKLALYVDQGLLGITHFQAAVELITKTRRKLGTFSDDPELQDEIMNQTEVLFTAMLDRLLEEKRLTVKSITHEVSHLLALAGMADPEEPAAKVATPEEERTVPVRAVLSNFQRINVAQLSAPELNDLVKVGQAQIRLAKARLKELGARDTAQ